MIVRVCVLIECEKREPYQSKNWPNLDLLFKLQSAALQSAKIRSLIWHFPFTAVFEFKMRKYLSQWRWDPYPLHVCGGERNFPEFAYIDTWIFNRESKSNFQTTAAATFISHRIQPFTAWLLFKLNTAIVIFNLFLLTPQRRGRLYYHIYHRVRY